MCFNRSNSQRLTAAVLQVHIFDRHNTHYTLPDQLRFGHPPAPQSKASNLEFHHEQDPFAFWVCRPCGEIIFDTRPANIPVHNDLLYRDGFPVRDTALPAYPLVFSDKYLQLASAVPDNAHIYGLGDVISTSGFRRDKNGTVQPFWIGDPAGNPVDRNLYGSHCFHLDVRHDGKGSQSHGVYLRNTHGMDAILRSGVIEYRCLGGTLDLTFVAGPTPHQVVQQYSDVVGKPAQMPFWSFGFHLCSINHKTLAETADVVKRMADAEIPLEVMWSDFYYMDRKRNFTLSTDFP